MAISLIYTSKDALKNLIPPKLQAQLSNDILGADSTDDDILLAVGAEAEAVFESYAASRSEYTLPIRDSEGNTPSIVITQVNKVWRGMLFDRAGILDKYPGIEESYAEAIQWMRDFGKNRGVNIPLGDTAKDEKIYKGEIKIVKSGSEKLAGFEA